MAVEAVVLIDAPVEQVWERNTDLQNSTDFIYGIDYVDILEKPNEGLLGLKWKETRTMFGQSASEIIWITDLERYQYYKTRAERPDTGYFLPRL